MAFFTYFFVHPSILNLDMTNRSRYQQKRQWSSLQEDVPYSMRSSMHSRMGQQPSAMQEMFRGNKNGIPRNKLYDMQKLLQETSQIARNRSALAIPNVPRSSVSQIEDIARENTAECLTDGTLINALLAGYADTMPSDDEMEDIPYSDESVVEIPAPILTSDLPQSNGIKRPVTVKADEWASYDSDSDDADDETNNPLTSTVTTTTEHDAGTLRRGAYNARRREKNAQNKQRAEERPKKFVKLSVSPKRIARPLPIPPRENNGVKAKFRRGERVVAKDGFSQTPSAIDYRKRIAYQKELEGKLREMLDQDIVEQVEAEGWITPAGRMYKAAIRMMERVQQERQDAKESSEGMLNLDLRAQRDRTQALEEDNNRFRGALGQLRQVLDDVEGSE